jgi:hypothetical protein
LNLSDQQLAELAFQGLIAPIKDRFTYQDIKNLAQLAEKASAFESWFQARKDRYQLVQIQSYSLGFVSDENEVGLVEWT